VQPKQDFTTYLANCWQMKDQLPTHALMEGFLSKQMEEGEITRYTGMMGLRKLQK
jgi:hypothetical protein